MSEPPHLAHGTAMGLALATVAFAVPEWLVSWEAKILLAAPVAILGGAGHILGRHLMEKWLEKRAQK